MEHSITSRVSRYAGLVDVDLLIDTPVSVVGCGAIGRQVAINLATMGVSNLTLFDFDLVEMENLGPQGWLPSDIGHAKTYSLSEYLKRVNPDITVKSRGRYDGDLPACPQVFCCVDTMATRKILNKALEDNFISFFCDTRMTSQSCRIITTTESEDTYYQKAYASTLFDDSEAAEEGCTTKSTYFCASVAAGLAVSQYFNFLRDLPVTFDFSVNLAAADLFVTPPPAVAEKIGPDPVPAS